MNFWRRPILLVGVFLSVGDPLQGQKIVRDLVFAKVDSHPLKLDLFLPEGVENPPLVVFIHGGGWKGGSYKGCQTCWLTESGFAVASISYRLTDRAQFPAQVHDCKAAVRWLRAHAKEHGYDAERVGVTGSSAGGHLALMLGVTAGDKDLEGVVGGNAEQSSQVHAVVDYFGPSDFLLRVRNQPEMTERPGSPVRQLLGKTVTEDPKWAERARPAYHVTKDDAPLLIFHGDRDPVVRIDQSQRMAEVYRQAGLELAMEVIPTAGHGGREFFSGTYREQAVAFLNKHLKR